MKISIDCKGKSKIDIKQMTHPLSGKFSQVSISKDIKNILITKIEIGSPPKSLEIVNCE